jgi:hypothetical protein
MMDKTSREERISAFVERFVYVCQTALIEELLRVGVLSVDEIDNVYRPFDGELLDPSVCISCKNDYVFLDSETGWCESCYTDLQTPQKIFEWWLVSPWLGKKLYIEGEPVIDNGFGIWWGRTITGQAISMDEVINTIYSDIMD